MTATFTHIARPPRYTKVTDNRRVLCGRLVKQYNCVAAEKATCTRCVAESLAQAEPKGGIVRRPA